jgi:hypothetical protein
MASIDEVSAAIGAAADSVDTVSAAVGASKSTTDELAGQLAALGVEGEAAQSNALAERLQSEATPLAQQLKSLLEEIRGQAEALRGDGLQGTPSAGAVTRSGSSAPPGVPADGPSVTRPALPSDPGRPPRGEPAVIEGTPDRKRSIQRENESADLLAQRGYDVERNPPPKPNGKEPDYRIQGDYWDCYAPTPTRSIDKIRKSIKDKVGEDAESRQADRIILNLDDNPADPAALKAILQRRPIPDLREIKIVRGGEVLDFYPFSRD